MLTLIGILTQKRSMQIDYTDIVWLYGVSDYICSINVQILKRKKNQIKATTNIKIYLFLIVWTTPVDHRENSDHSGVRLLSPHAGFSLQGLILQNIATPAF